MMPADKGPQNAAELYEDRVQANAIVKAAVNQVGGKKWCIEQAVKIASAPQPPGVSVMPLELAKAFYAFMCEA